MLEAVLFDLDGTLLDIELDAFLREYFALLGPVVGGLAGTRPSDALAAVMAGTRAMAARHPGRLNRDVFAEVFEQLTSVDLATGEAARRLDEFYRDEFPSLKGSHGPRPGGSRAVEAARELGLKTALATNPIFPRAAIEERMRWAGLDADLFDVVTSYESSTACKPQADYFQEVADDLGVRASRCIMVGDDPALDLGAAAAGMRTFLLADGGHPAADWCGDLQDLTRLLPSLA